MTTEKKMTQKFRRLGSVSNKYQILETQTDTHDLLQNV